MPGVDFTKMMTEDGMHLEPDGLLQCEMSRLLPTSHPTLFVVMPTSRGGPSV